MNSSDDLKNKGPNIDLFATALEKLKENIKNLKSDTTTKDDYFEVMDKKNVEFNAKFEVMSLIDLKAKMKDMKSNEMKSEDHLEFFRLRDVIERKVLENTDDLDKIAIQTMKAFISKSPKKVKKQVESERFNIKKLLKEENFEIIKSHDQDDEISLTLCMDVLNNSRMDYSDLYFCIEFDLESKKVKSYEFRWL